MTENNNEMALSPWQPFRGQGVQKISSLDSRAHSNAECGGLKVCTVNVGSLKGRSREVVMLWPIFGRAAGPSGLASGS